MADIHDASDAELSGVHRRILSVTAVLAKPAVPLVVLALVLVWLAANSLLPKGRVWDPPPFPFLGLGATITALFSTLLIIAAQRREEEVARRRAQLTLQLAALSEQKIAKVISLLEEQRRENPLLPDRADALARDMSTGTDPAHILDRIIETHESKPSRRAASPSLSEKD
jgi:uncharacterized membrane protein